MDTKYEARQYSTEASPPSYQTACTPQQHAHLYQPPQYQDRPVSPRPIDSGRPIESFTPVPTTSSNRLQKPIAIPATSKKLGSPFLRAYPPALEQFALPREVFLRFVDDLNRVAVASPPLQVLGLAGNIVSMIPLHTAQIVGGAVNAASTVGVIAVSKGRTEVFLRQSNKDIFQPRGLKVELAKLNALAKIAKMPFLDEDGEIGKHTAILQPITDSDTLINVSGQARRLQALEPWIERLDLAPLINMQVQDNPLSRLNAAASERQRKKEEEKILKSRGSANKGYHKDSTKALEEYEKEMNKVDKEEKKAQKEKKLTKMQAELEKIEEKRLKIRREYEQEMQKIEKDHQKEDKEEEGVRKILWLVIRNIEASSQTSTP